MIVPLLRKGDIPFTLKLHYDKVRHSHHSDRPQGCRLHQIPATAGASVDGAALQPQRQVRDEAGGEAHEDVRCLEFSDVHVVVLVLNDLCHQ